MNRLTNQRTQLTRQYRESKRPAGVYVIRNLVNQRVYVQGSTDLPSAMNRDRFELKLKGHRNERLQADWIEHGEGNFRFEIVDTLDAEARDDLNDKGWLASLLELWRAELRSYGDSGYNTRMPSAWLRYAN